MTIIRIDFVQSRGTATVENDTKNVATIKEERRREPETKRVAVDAAGSPWTRFTFPPERDTISWASFRTSLTFLDCFEEWFFPRFFPFFFSFFLRRNLDGLLNEFRIDSISVGKVVHLFSPAVERNSGNSFLKVAYFRNRMKKRRSVRFLFALVRNSGDYFVEVYAFLEIDRKNDPVFHSFPKGIVEIYVQ